MAAKPDSIPTPTTEQLPRLIALDWVQSGPSAWNAKWQSPGSLILNISIYEGATGSWLLSGIPPWFTYSAKHATAESAKQEAELVLVRVSEWYDAGGAL